MSILSTKSKFPHKNLSLLFIIAIISLFSLSECAPLQDLVTFNFHVNYTHNWYSGYLNFSYSHYHYVYFDSQYDPDNDPIILWLNGGPGCSSLIGMVTQNGPFIFQPNTTTLVLNQYAWNKKANLLYLQSPGGVGFSKGQRSSYNDQTTAQDNLKAMLAFYQKFPNLKKNELYLTGQSYAGIYVPYLANEIIKFNKLPTSKQKVIKLKGLMVGNACTDPKQCYEATAQGNSQYFYQFLYKHTYISENQYMLYKGSCGMAFNSEQCKKQRAVLDKKFQNTNSSILNIYAPCYYQSYESNMQTINQMYNIIESENENKKTTKKQKRSQRVHKSIFVNASDLDCQDSFGIHHLFNDPLMFRHLHVDFIKWSQCSDWVQQNYVSFSNGSIWIYPILIKQGLRIWVFSGDVDADVPITGTLRWIDLFREEHGLPVIQPWREWWVRGKHQHEDQVGGMVWKLKNLTFVSVKGAGHMVPKDKPKQAYTLIDSFIRGVGLPEKDEGNNQQL